VPGITATLVVIAALISLTLLSSVVLETRLARALDIRGELIETLEQTRKDAMRSLMATTEATLSDDQAQRKLLATEAHVRALSVQSSLDKLASKTATIPSTAAAIANARDAWGHMAPAAAKAIEDDRASDEHPTDIGAREFARTSHNKLVQQAYVWNTAISHVYLDHARATSKLSHRYELVALLDLAFSLCLLVIAGGIVVLGVAQPLREFERGLARVAAGERDVRVEPRGVEEARALARGFNAMADALESRDLRIGAQSTALTARNLALAAANVELDYFAYAASHDLRAPLRGIDSMARFLQEDLAAHLDDRSRSYLDRIRRAAQRLDRLISDLLEVARAGRALGPTSEVDLGDAAREALSGLEEAVRASGGTVELAPDLPVVRGDRTRLVLVFQNLLSNAVKYSSGPKRVPRIAVRGHVAGSTAVVSVEDNGIGIPRDQIDRIFGLFRRLHREGEYEGTGVGLAIVKRIVGAHGGRVEVESEVGRGSKFKVSLPLRGSPEPADAEA
jgi:signal transduction histidine kinase